jgi:branched-chain amino acid transport system ATP-binding protein
MSASSPEEVAVAPRLSLRGLSASYGGGDVLAGISLDIRPGELCALLGPNGAGKTTLLRAISGLVRVTGGSILLDGRPVHNQPPHRIVEAGVAHVPQGRALFPYSTGYENLRAGGYIRKDRAGLAKDIEDFLDDWPIARTVLDRNGALMSGGEQQVVALGRALMSRPRLILLDEPSLGLAPILVGQLFAMIKRLVKELSERGTAVLLVEQNVRKAVEVADQVHVLVNGRIVFSGSAAGLAPEDVASMYMVGA